MHETIAEIRKNRTNFPLVLRFRSTVNERIVKNGGTEIENRIKILQEYSAENSKNFCLHFHQFVQW